MAIYVTGDTHGGINQSKLHTKNFKIGSSLNKSDYVIIAGDFGIWRDKGSRAFIEFLNSKPFTTLFVEGNHEDYAYLETFPLIDMFGNKVRKISDSIYQLIRGEIYNIDGLSVFAFGGARSIDVLTAGRILGRDFFLEEECTFAEESRALTNLENVDNKVDLIISHTGAASAIEEICKLYGLTVREFDAQNKFFEFIKTIVDYKLWVFGHMHYDLQLNNNEIVVFEKVICVNEVLLENDRYGFK